MSPLRAGRYLLREAVADVWNRRAANLVSVCTITASLYVLGLFVLLGFNVERLVASWAEENRVSVFLADSIPDSTRESLARRLEADPLVRSVELLTRDAARERFLTEFPDLADLVGGLGTNPLPASFEVTLDGGRAAPPALEVLIRSLREAPGVDGVRCDLDWVRRVRSLMAMIGLGGGILAGILVLAASITISGVVRLNVLARRDEIEILGLVGATRSFIRGPFLVEGAFQGLAAAVLSAALLGGTWAFVASRPEVRADRLLAGLAGGPPPLWGPLALVLIGLGVGVAGALVSVRSVSRPGAA